MNRGVIISFILYVINSFADWFDSSILGKINRAFGHFFGKLSNGSFFVKWFTGAKDNDTRDSSVVYRCIVFLKRFVTRIVSKLGALISKSLFVSAIRWFLHNITAISSANYGVFAVCASVSYFLLRVVTGGFALRFAIVCLALFAVGVAGCAFDVSMSQLFSGSFASKFLLSFADIPQVTDSKKIRMTRASGAVFSALGIVCGVVGFAIGAKFTVVALVGVIFVCTVLYNYRVGVYTALVVFPYAPTMAIVGIILLSMVSFAIALLVFKSVRFSRSNLDIPIAMFLAVMLLSSVTSYARSSSLKIYMVYFVFVCSYYLITNTFKSFKQLVPVICTMMICALGVAAYGIYQHIYGFADGTVWTDTDMFDNIATRVVSTFENPNVLGEYLLLMIPVGAALFIASDKRVVKVSNLAITAALALCMIYTYSRGNWIGLIVAAFLFVLFYDTRFVWLGVIAVFAAPMFMGQEVIARFASIGDTRDSSTSYRVYIWIGTLRMLRDYWICGIGLGSDAFNMVYPRYSYAGIIAPHSHNLYLQLLTENGILGLAVFVAIIILYYRDVITCVTKQQRCAQKALTVALAAGVFGYLVQGMFDNVWYNYRVFFMFFAIVGLTSAIVNSAKKGGKV